VQDRRTGAKGLVIMDVRQDSVLMASTPRGSSSTGEAGAPATGRYSQGSSIPLRDNPEVTVSLTNRRFLMALVATLTLAGSSELAAQSSPCALLTSAEAVKHIARGRPTYGQTPDVVTLGGGAGSVCEYPSGQIGVWRAPKAEESLMRFLKAWKADNATRHPVSGVGDKAWIMFPVPEDKYKDRLAYLVANVGQQIVTVALVARDGQADGVMGEVCRGDQSRLKADEKEGCKKILADKSETQESLQPAVVELAKLVVAKVRAGKGS
jgi:hypothetical protein